MSSAKKLLLAIGDAALLYGALAATILIRYPFSDFGPRWDDHRFPFSILFLAWLLIFWLTDFYGQRSFVNYNSLANRILTATGIAAVASALLFYLFEDFFRLTPKTNLLIFSAVVALAEYFFRSIFLAISRFRPQPAVVIGDSKEIRELLDFLKTHPHAGYQTAIWSPKMDSEITGNFREKVESSGAHTIIVQPSLTKDPVAIRTLYDLLPLGVNILNFHDFYELVFERVPLEDLEEGWFIEHVATRRPAYDRAKRLADFLLAAIAFVILLPLSILIWLMIRLTSKGPAIYTQKRYGRNDSVFTLYKFRTMKHGAEGAYWTLENDDRVTGIGRILRFTHLDEIPQLWNIIRGDISFTGPRPERVELADEFRKFPYYNIRHVVTPGLTGWAQINYKPSASLEEGLEKLKYDIYYIKNRSFLLDLAIILKTIKYIFTPAR